MTFEEWQAAKEARKRRKAHNKDYGIPAMNEDTKELKAEMKDGFHKRVRERDRVDQYLQMLEGKTHRLPPNAHADHVIPQAGASREQKTDPRYGIGALATTNLDRFEKRYRAAILIDGPLFWQVIWKPGTDTQPEKCYRRRMEPDGEVGLFWLDYERPDWMMDGHEYNVTEI
jgi:hypothetical protein